MWGIPGARAPRRSRRSSTCTAADGTTRLAGQHATRCTPKTRARYALTDDERKTIAVYPMDLGGQYWSRQNTGFVPFTSGDPVTPGRN